MAAWVVQRPWQEDVAAIYEALRSAKLYTVGNPTACRVCIFGTPNFLSPIALNPKPFEPYNPKP